MRFTVGNELAGQRLDRALVRHLPGHALRACRRLLADGNVLVNGRRGHAGLRLSPSDVIEISASRPEGLAPSGTILKITTDFCYFHKPANLHTVELAGRQNASLERQLPLLMPPEYPAPTLLQRLDYGTSGIICASFTALGAQLFRAKEAAGICAKYYLALLAGNLNKTIVARNALDTGHGARVRPLTSTGDKTRWSVFTPLCHMPSWQIGESPAAVEDATLAICGIARGQRHQIRAHAQAMGFPLAGDPIYGAEKGQGFFLEHFYLDFAGRKIFDLGKESFYNRLPPFAQSSIRRWLKKEAGIEPA